MISSLLRSYRSAQFFERGFPTALTPTLTKIVAVALIALSFLVVAIYSHYKARQQLNNDHIELKKDEKNIGEIVNQRLDLKPSLVEQETSDSSPEVKKVEDHKNAIFKKQKIDSISDLPEEILTLIYTQLDFESWDSLRWTDKRFKRISEDPRVIASLLVKEEFIEIELWIKFIQLADTCLTKLDLSHPNRDIRTLTNKDIENELIQIFQTSNIQELNLSGIWLSDDKLLKNLPPHLKSLDLSRCGIEGPLDLLPRGLKFLNLAQNDDLTDAGIAKLPSGLQSLNLSHCSKITDVGIAAIVELKSLESISLTGCHSLKKEGIAKLIPNVQSDKLRKKLTVFLATI